MLLLRRRITGQGVAGLSTGSVHPRTELVELRPQGVSSPSHGLRAASGLNFKNARGGTPVELVPGAGAMCERIHQAPLTKVERRKGPRLLKAA